MVQIKKVSIENYRGIKKDEFQVSPKGVIFSGRNGIGKTSRIEAIYWCLTGVLFDNSSKGVNDKIKTIQTGKKKPIRVSLQITDSDGELFFITKEVKEKWNTKKASNEEIYEGDETNYIINGNPYIKKDYDTVVGRIFGFDNLKNEVYNNKKFELLKKIDWFNLVTNPNYIKKLDNKTIRELLIFSVNDFNLEEITMSEQVKDALSNETFDFAKKKLNDDIKDIKKQMEINDVKVSTFQNDINTLLCPKCGISFKDAHGDEVNKLVKKIDVDTKDLLKKQVKKESLLAEIELIEREYLKRLDAKVREYYQSFAHIEIIDENLKPTLNISFLDQVGHWVNMENGINTGDGILRLTLFIMSIKLVLNIPQSIIFLDSLETLDEKNTDELLQINEQLFATQVIRNKKTLIKKQIGEDNNV
jgi:DNA repair exonuclease SbcCD ATPase subunit